MTILRDSPGSGAPEFVAPDSEEARGRLHLEGLKRLKAAGCPAQAGPDQDND